MGIGGNSWNFSFWAFWPQTRTNMCHSIVWKNHHLEKRAEAVHSNPWERWSRDVADFLAFRILMRLVHDISNPKMDFPQKATGWWAYTYVYICIYVYILDYIIYCILYKYILLYIYYIFYYIYYIWYFVWDFVWYFVWYFVWHFVFYFVLFCSILYFIIYYIILFDYAGCRLMVQTTNRHQQISSNGRIKQDEQC